LGQQEIDDPTAAGMLDRSATMVEHLGVGATGPFKRVGQLWKFVPRAALADSLSQPENGRSA
jgi:hypothetical protein